MWNLKKKKKWYKWIYLQNRNKLKKKKYGYQGKELKAGIYWEYGIDV